MNEGSSVNLLSGEESGEWQRRYFESASADTLHARPAEALAACAAGHRQRAATRKPEEILVWISPAQANGLTAVETCIEDMPFLVDTLVMVLRERGAAVDWIVHPVLRVRRDAQGRLLGLADEGSGTAESWIHAEVEHVAEPEELRRLLIERLSAVRITVADYAAMRARLLSVCTVLRTTPRGCAADEIAEAREFLRWLDADHFSYFGVSETRAEPGDEGRTRLTTVAEAGLGLARSGQPLADVDALIAPREELEKYADSPRVVVVIKAGLRSGIRSPDFMDVVTVKLFSAGGSVTGSVRFIGLFSSEAYEERPWAIPLIRRKVQLVLQRSGLDPDSHSGKNLREIIGSFPRDELFQSGEDELLRTCLGIRELRERQHLRLFLRRDRYGRFFSVLVYLPRDRYSRELRERVAHELMSSLSGLSVDRNVEFLRGGLARIHYLVRTPPGTKLAQSAEEIEQRMQQLTRPWREQLRDALLAAGQADAVELSGRFGEAFAPAYIERVGIAETAADTVQLAALGPLQPIRPRLDAGAQRLKLYMSGEPLALSDVLPVLENFGLRVIRQDPEPVTPAGARSALWIQDFQVVLPAAADSPAAARNFEQGLIEVLRGQAEDDALNALILGAGLRVRQVVCLRTLARYVNQIGLPFGRADIDRAIAAQPKLARLTVALFEARFDPQLQDTRRRDAEIAAAQGLDQALDEVTSLDADRILRALVSVVRAGLRTNYFQPDADGQPKPWVSLKLDPAKVPELPRPRPMFEIWVCAPTVEGIHLRGGRVARGGLRWSDRREDFRTEVLGLMKAQQVKNAVIVPVGAKGGFVVKKGPPVTEREAWMANGIACYRSFLRGLLDLTDNLVNDAVVPPPAVVRHDGDDPYLVVAADKGTATFSDIANGVAADYDFWLGDAFASGGSAGYDHKKMGITARGAWKSVQRHFRELDLDIQKQAFTVVGVGDMSGDVFGNGMLLSPQIRLIAAFDHRHVFLDPEPDAARSLAERQRLFALPRSSWADYDASLISEGGGVFARSAKLIRVSPQAARALGCEPRGMTPSELIQSILRAPADLLWNGGIGTYVKASTQSHDEVRDRSNDAVRVNGRELRVRVVGEGGNLGLTQAGRIEYARRGGRINTDAIDNSGGVHSSDREVNIKIPLNPLLREHRIGRAERDALLASMTDEVAAFVLRDNEVQSGCISLMEAQAAERLDEHAALMRHLEREGVLDRGLEGLPDDEGLQERRAERQGLTRPELAVLVAYAKITLFDAALATDMPDDPFFVPVLLANFPRALVAAHREALIRHRLRREIIATILANAVVNRMGVSFAHRLADDQGVSRAEVLKAYAAAHELFGGDVYWTAVEKLDGRVPAKLQYRLMHMTAALLKHVTGWLIRTRLTERLSVGQIVERYAATVPEIERLLPQVLPGSYREDYERVLAGLRSEQVPDEVALRLTRTKALGSALDLFDLAEETGMALESAARTYFELGEKLRMPWMLGAIVQLSVTNQWQALARSKLRDDAYRLHRLLAGHVIRAGGVDAWSAANERRLKFSLSRLAELQASGPIDYAGLAVAVRELYALQLG